MSSTKLTLIDLINSKDICTIQSLLKTNNFFKSQLIQAALYALELHDIEIFNLFQCQQISKKDVLIAAVEHGSSSAVHDLHDMNVDMNHYMLNGDTIIIYATLIHAFDCAKTLVECGADINMRSLNGHSILTRIAQQSGNYTQEIEYLLQQNIDIDVRSSYGWTPLHHCVKIGNINTLSQLLIHGACVNSQTVRNNQTALMIAVMYAQVECIQMLLSHNANVHLQNSIGETCIIICFRYTHAYYALDIIKLLLCNGASLNICDNVGETCLYAATFRNNVSMINICIEYNTPITIQNNYGITLFILAISNKNESFARYLLRNSCIISNMHHLAEWSSILSKHCSISNSLDIEKNMYNSHQLNILFFGSGEYIDISMIEHPHYIAEIALTRSFYLLKEHCRYFIRKHLLCLSNVNLITRIELLPLPVLLKKFLYFA